MRNYRQFAYQILLGRRLRDGFVYDGRNKYATGGPTIEPHLGNVILRPGNVFIDIGANAGGWTVPASRLYKQVWAFEPNPSTLEVLRKNVGMNHATNVRIFPCALGERTTKLTMYTSSMEPGKNGFWNHHGDRYTDGHVEVSVKRLDDLAVNVQVSTIKIDTEGFETQVLKGAAQTVRKWRPNLAIETHRDGDAEIIKNMFPMFDWTEFRRHEQTILLTGV